MPANAQNAFQHELTNPRPMPAGTQTLSQRVLTKSLPFQREHKMNFNMC